MQENNVYGGLRRQFYSDILETFAFGASGGIGVWCDWQEEDIERDAQQRRCLTALRGCRDAEDGEKFADITLDTIRDGVRAILNNKLAINSVIRQSVVDAWRENDASHIGATEADYIVQAGLFGEIVYG